MASEYNTSGQPDYDMGGDNPNAPPPTFGTGQSQEEIDFDVAVQAFQDEINDWQREVRDARDQLRELAAGQGVRGDEQSVADLRAKVKKMTDKANTATGVMSGQIPFMSSAQAELQDLRNSKAAMKVALDDANAKLAAALAAPKPTVQPPPPPPPPPSTAAADSLKRRNMIDFAVAMHDDLFGAIDRAKYFHEAPKSRDYEYSLASNYMWQELNGPTVKAWKSITRSSWEAMW